MRKLLTVGLSILLLLVFSGCGEDTAAPSVDLKALSEEMLAADPSLPRMVTVDSEGEKAEEYFAAFSDLSFDKVGKFFLSYAEDGSAFEIAVVELKSESDLQDLKQTLEDHVEQRVSLYRTYAPEQVKQAENAEIVSKGKYAALIMCEDLSGVKNAFFKAFS